MAYADRRERNKGVRYRGMYKAADGRYRYQPVGVAADEQDRDAHRGHHLLVTPPMASHPHERTRSREEGFLFAFGGDGLTLAGQRDRRRQHRRVGS